VANEIDALVKASIILALAGGRSRRWLYNMVKRGDFPPPDRPARRRGEADLWRESTVRKGLDKYSAQSA
jgi:predicted DNA-binding transcriptional regulator AlpA